MSVNNEIVRLESFIQSTRDSGYKSTSAALAELVDNSIEANARNIHIIIEKNPFPNNEGINIRAEIVSL